MAQSATRFASTLAALLLGSTALCGSAQAGWFDFGSKSESAAPQSKSAVVKSDTVKPAETLDGSIEQARILRQTGNYQESIRHLSQLMIVASDDSRVGPWGGIALRGERSYEEFRALDPHLNQAIQHMMGLPAERVLKAARGLLEKNRAVQSGAA